MITLSFDEEPWIVATKCVGLGSVCTRCATQVRETDRPCARCLATPDKDRPLEDVITDNPCITVISPDTSLGIASDSFLKIVRNGISMPLLYIVGCQLAGQAVHVAWAASAV